MRKRWPNLSRFGASLQCAFGISVNASPHSALVIKDEDLRHDHLLQFGFERRGHVLVRLGETKFNIADLKSWFPGFSNDDIFEAEPQQVLFQERLPEKVLAPPAITASIVGFTANSETNEQKTTPIRIEDVGEKIGGARKDFHRRTLAIADLAAMNDIERREMVERKNIWPALDMKAMQSAGVPFEVAGAIGHLRRLLENKPKNDVTDAEYISAISSVRDAFVGVNSIATFNDACIKLHELHGHVQRNEKGEIQWRRWLNSDPFANAIGNKAASRLAWPELQISAFCTRGTSYEDYFSRQVRGVKSKPRDLIETRPHLKNINQSGIPDYANGRVITGDDFLADFGFRAVEFGNWVDQKERAVIVRMAYNSLHNLASVLDLPSKAIGLGGKLALAFGARGRGGSRAPSAHYEPTRQVMNLTRTKGAGSLAHEWFHALDDHLSRLVANNHGYDPLLRKRSTYYLSENICDVVKEAYGTSESGQIEQFFNRHVNVIGDRSGMDKTFLSISLCLGRAIFLRTQNEERATQSANNAARGTHYAAAWLIEAARAASFNLPTAQELQKQFVDPFMMKYEESGTGDITFFAQKITRDLSYGKLPPRKADRIALKVAKNLRYATQCQDLANNLRCGRTDHFVPTTFADNAAKLDSKRAKPYYGLACEMSARSFECFVFDHMAVSGISDDYLVHGVEESRYAARESGNPYPQGNERKSINGAMCAYFAEIKRVYGHELLAPPEPNIDDTVVAQVPVSGG